MTNGLRGVVEVIMERVLMVLVVMVAVLCFASSVEAADRNDAFLRGNAARKVVYSIDGDPYRVEVYLAVTPSLDRLRLVPFDCDPAEDLLICAFVEMFPGCTTQTTSVPDGDGPGTLVETTECVTFDKDAGSCIETDAFHTGEHLQSTGIQFSEDGCTAGLAARSTIENSTNLWTVTSRPIALTREIGHNDETIKATVWLRNKTEEATQDIPVSCPSGLWDKCLALLPSGTPEYLDGCTLVAFSHVTVVGDPVVAFVDHWLCTAGAPHCRQPAGMIVAIGTGIVELVLSDIQETSTDICS